jgi:hypothetical protein
MPPVEVAAARLPAQSRATAPTVPWRRASSASTRPASSWASVSASARQRASVKK